MYHSGRSSRNSSSNSCCYPSSSSSQSSCSYPTKKCEDSYDDSGLTISVSPNTPIFPCCSESDSTSCSNSSRNSCSDTCCQTSSCSGTGSYCSCSCSGDSTNSKTDDKEHRLFKVSFLSLNDGSKCFVVNGHRRPILRLKEGIRYHFVICDMEEGHRFMLTNNPIGKFPGLPLKTLRGGFAGGNGSFVFCPDGNTPRIFAYQSNKLAFAGNYVTVDSA